MEVHIVYPRPDTAIVSLHGQLDIDASQPLYNVVDELRTVGAHRVVVDLAAVEFCDSIGLSALVVGHRYCADRGGWLRLANPNAFLLRLLAVIGVASAIPIYRGVAAARTGDHAARVRLGPDGAGLRQDDPAA